MHVICWIAHDLKADIFGPGRYPEDSHSARLGDDPSAGREMIDGGIGGGAQVGGCLRSPANRAT